MKNFLLDQTPHFDNMRSSLKDKDGKQTDYLLHNDKDMYVFVVQTDGCANDHVVFSRQDLKALWCMLTTGGCNGNAH